MVNQFASGQGGGELAWLLPHHPTFGVWLLFTGIGSFLDRISSCAAGKPFRTPGQGDFVLILHNETE